MKITQIFSPLKIYFDCGNRSIDKSPFVIMKESFKGKNKYSVWHSNAGFECTKEEIVGGIRQHFKLIHANIEIDENQEKFINDLIDKHCFEHEIK